LRHISRKNGKEIKIIQASTAAAASIMLKESLMRYSLFARRVNNAMRNFIAFSWKLEATTMLAV
jgi:hypothetical protein